MAVIVFFTYVYAIRYKSKLHKYIRTFLVFALAIFWLYLNFDLAIEYTSGGRYPYTCQLNDRHCMLDHSITILSIITNFIIILEVAITAKNGPLPDTYPVILDAKQEQVPSQAMYASQVPQPLQPPLLSTMSQQQQQQQYMQSYPAAYYPQQQYQPYQGMPQQQQPLTTATPQATGIL
ncbi:hypothetical protein BGZ79_009542, partial [Entomortierella chlamydospora]